MTRKEAIQAELDFFKLILSAIIGAAFAVSIYNIQVGGSIVYTAASAVIVLCIAFAIFYWKYKVLLKELEKL